MNADTMSDAINLFKVDKAYIDLQFLAVLRL